MFLLQLVSRLQQLNSLNSKCPVILLDRWNRYEHCKAEKNENMKNMPMYYVSNETSLKIVLIPFLIVIN